MSYLVVSNAKKSQDSHKVRMAKRFGIPVVSLAFLDKCVESKEVVDADEFVVAGKTAAAEFKSGRIVGNY